MEELENCPRAKKAQNVQKEPAPTKSRDKEKKLAKTPKQTSEQQASGTIVIDIGLENLNQDDNSTIPNPDSPKLVQSQSPSYSPDSSNPSAEDVFEETYDSSEEANENSEAKDSSAKEDEHGSEEDSASFSTAESKRSKKQKRKAELKKLAETSSKAFSS
ncbi:unnamed protein product [Arabis nemorensis]|uniref:Uncharacterized protein n=1 Tax=Arabis nemorensis TaxID=586526 RepID=A0A565BPU2_9BRAS|nr:unnamed protein product [Arabis nemorensis]